MNEKVYTPPYTLTDEIVTLISDITELVVGITINNSMNNNPKLRRDNRIKTIHASLAIENRKIKKFEPRDYMR